MLIIYVRIYFSHSVFVVKTSETTHVVSSGTLNRTQLNCWRWVVVSWADRCYQLVVNYLYWSAAAASSRVCLLFSPPRYRERKLIVSDCNRAYVIKTNRPILRCKK